MRNTRERVWGGRLPLLAQLRSVQAAAALRQALAARPDLAQAHGDLAGLYQQLGYQDLALKHFKECLACTARDGRTPGESAEDFATRLGRLSRYTADLDREVKRLLGVYEVRAYNLTVLDQAHTAQSLGLMAKALEILAGSNIGAYGVEGTQLELEWNLSVGDLEYVRGWTVYPELENALGTNNYHWLKTRLAAAGGSYAEADAELQAMVIRAVTISEGRHQLPLRSAVALVASQAILEGSIPSACPVQLLHIRKRQHELTGQMHALTVLLRRESDLHVLRGLLDLESGRPEAAESHFRAGLSLWQSAEAAARGAGLDFPGREIAERFLEMSGAH
jgi:tetratricopeptide (TPR) repeat protein